MVVAAPVAVLLAQILTAPATLAASAPGEVGPPRRSAAAAMLAAPTIAPDAVTPPRAVALPAAADLPDTGAEPARPGLGVEFADSHRPAGASLDVGAAVAGVTDAGHAEHAARRWAGPQTPVLDRLADRARPH